MDFSPRGHASAPVFSPRLLFIDAGAALGGSEHLLLTLIDGFKKRGARIDFCHRDDGALLPAFRDRAHRVRRMPELSPLAVRHPLRALLAIHALGRVARSARADAVITASPQDFSMLGLWRRLGGPPVLAHLGWLLPQRSPLYRKSLGWIDAGVAPAPAIAADWQALGWPRSRLHVVPNGIDLGRFQPASDRAALRASLGLAPRQRQVVFCGRVVPEKGVFTLLRAWALRRPPDARLDLFGPVSAEMRERLGRLAAELRLPAESWALPGPLAEPERRLAAADVVVVPSENAEPFGLGAIEAMACGAPVVLSDSGALPTLVPDGAGRDILHTAGDADALADRLHRWLDASPAERAAQGAFLARHVRSRFGADAMVDQYAAILAPLLAHDSA